MPLFTDGTISTVAELNDQDSYVLDVASNESIDLTRKMALAQEEIGVELSALLPQTDSFDRQFLLQGTPLSSVVVTPALRLWHVYHTLELVYRDAYSSQLNERYQGKWKEYAELSRWAAEKLMQTGVGIAASPVAQAEPPTLTTVSGGLTAGTYYVSAAWVNASTEEGANSAARTVAVSYGATFQVTMAEAPAHATAWNVYAGVSAEDLVRQNTSPIAVGTVWTQPAALATTGSGPGTGQRPSYLRALPRILQRG
jgi:hypothetical protein